MHVRICMLLGFWQCLGFRGVVRGWVRLSRGLDGDI